MRIVLLGPPGAGKGTQAKRLAETFDLAHLSSGDILRAEKAGGSELGKTLAQYMDAGRLVPDDVVVSVMASAIARPRKESGLLLDGFPRTVPQAKALDEQLGRLDVPLDLVVVIDVDENEIVGRITGRRSCPQCGEAYHVRFLPPRVDEVCDKCGAKLIQRDDDKEAVVRKRLAVYGEQTAPLIDYYRGRDQSKVLSFNGSKKPDEVTADMVAALRRYRQAGA